MRFAPLPTENIKQHALLEQLIRAPKLYRYEVKNINCSAAEESGAAIFYSVAEINDFVCEQRGSNQSLKFLILKSLLIEFENEFYESKTIVAPAQLFELISEDWETKTNRLLLTQIVARICESRTTDFAAAVDRRESFSRALATIS